MCFSLGASIASAAVLIPAGLFCIKKSAHMDKSYWALALLPFAFGIQQLFEGGVWWAIEAGNEEVLRLSAMGFIFFSHLFWLAWVPFTCYLTETIKIRRKLFLLITITGVVCGAAMFLPFLFNSHWLEVSVVNHSIAYQTTFAYDDYLSRIAGTIIYILIIIFPLIISSDQYHRVLGILILFSMIVSLIFFNFAFISVWCYFAAIISLYIYYIIAIRAKPAKYAL